MDAGRKLMAALPPDVLHPQVLQRVNRWLEHDQRHSVAALLADSVAETHSSAAREPSD